MSRKNKNPFILNHIQPITDNQKLVFDSYQNDKNIVMHGYAGTGKTFCAVYLALDDLMTYKSYKEVIIIRSVVPSRDMGFLPGNEKEKSKVYEEPYKEICDELFGRGDGYEILKMKKMMKFITTSFLRGLTFNDSIVIVDEIQNMTFSELDTIITRLGDNSRIIFCGDYRQSDLSTNELSGVKKFMKILKKIDSFDYVEFTENDIVRSGIVKDYIIQKNKE